MDSNTDPTGLLGSFVPQPGTVAEYPQISWLQVGLPPSCALSKITERLDTTVVVESVSNVSVGNRSRKICCL